MRIQPGLTILHYEVSALIGKGGMGEVFRATDSKLGRQVAIKVLPEEFTRDAERIARFEREARLLASLSHPHVAAIHGVEDVDGLKFLVMELAEGENLSDRLMRGPIPIDETIEIALQIADALEAAHEKGIVHRDLKPANIKVNADNRAQVLDFGLAKAFETDEADADYSNSPTMVRAASQMGVILGTAAYMSPEQARGRRIDKRADIWAFGVVLWEMVTGKRLFGGETVSDTLAAVLKEEPDWSLLPSEIPSGIRRVLRRCLTRNPKDRLRDIGDARLELREVSASFDEPSAGLAAGIRTGRRLWLLPALLVFGLLSGAGLAQWLGGERTSNVSRGAQLSLTLPPEAGLAAGSFLPALAFSPDGRSIAYVGIGPDAVRRLYVRQLDQGEPRLLPGTEGAEGPFFSPDGDWIAFWSPWKLRKVRVSGSGLPEIVCNSIDFRGGTWATDTIVFAPGQSSELYRVSDRGGQPERLTTKLSDEQGHRFPQVLPDGETILFTARPTRFDPDRAEIVTVSLSSGDRKDLGQASIDVRVSATGHLLYVQAGRLIVVPFDLDRKEVTGSARTIVENVVVQKNTGAAQFAVSPYGHLAWIPGGLSGDDMKISRVDRGGNSTPIYESPGLSRHPHLSPDDRHVLVMAIGPDIGGTWIMSSDGRERRRLTSSPGTGVWMSDRQWVGNADSRTSWNGLFVDSIDGSTPRRELLRIGTNENISISASSVSAEGVLAYSHAAIDGNLDVSLLDLTGDGTARSFLAGPANEGGALFSPDGRYVAYVSDQTGQFEVYVTTFPERAATWQVSTAGGSEVVWRRDGKELFFRSGQELVAVPVTLEPTFHAGSPAVLFRGPYEGVLGNPQNPNYDAAADGSWFLMMQSPELDQSVAELRIALDWPAVLAPR